MKNGTHENRTCRFQEKRERERERRRADGMVWGRGGIINRPCDVSVDDGGEDGSIVVGRR